METMKREEISMGLESIESYNKAIHNRNVRLDFEKSKLERQNMYKHCNLDCIIKANEKTLLNINNAEVEEE